MPLKKWILQILIGLLIYAPAFGMVILEKVDIKDDSSVDLVFNGKINRNQINVEYLNDIIQLSFRGASIYPAKIFSVNRGSLAKIFTYQYSPEVVRARFSVRGKALDFKDKLQLNYSAKAINFKIIEAVSAPSRSEESKNPEEATAEEELSEKDLLDKVLKAGSDPKNTKSLVQSESTQEKANLTAGKPLPPLWPVFFKLGIAVVGVLVLVMGLKKLNALRLTKSPGLVKAINQFAQSAMTPKNKVIEIVSTQHLDQKKKIVVVRVSEVLLVLGVTHDSINLITRISPEDESSHQDSKNDEKDVFKNGFKDGFSELLSAESEKDEFSFSSAPNLVPSARSRIRSRLEGLKTL